MKDCCLEKEKKAGEGSCHCRENSGETKSCCREQAEAEQSCHCHAGKEEGQSSRREEKAEPSCRKEKDACHCHEKSGETKSRPHEEEAAAEVCCCAAEGMKGKPKKATEERQSYCGCCGGGEKQSYSSCCGEGAKKRGRTRQIVILAISLAALVVSFIGPLKNHAVLRYLDFGWIAVVLCGTPIFKSAVKGLGRRKVTSSLLISVSILACITLEILMLTGVLGHDGHSHSNIFAAGEVAWLMAIGELIEDFTVSRARSGIERLISLAPTTARYRVGNDLVDKPVSEVRVGDIVTVLPNDMISVDGVIVSGETAVDESVMTGESVPVDKGTGDSVFGGTWNKSGALEVRVTSASDDMAVEKLKRLVVEAEGKKAPISKIADRWAGYIVPAAVVLSVVLFLFAYFILNAGLVESIVRGVTMLVVFCPCALALATPTAVAAGLGSGTKKGILIKSGGTLESLARIDTVAFDKTGTLTTGRISVADLIPVGTDSGRVKAIAGACERMSEHPIAKAVVEACSDGADLPPATEVKSLVGTGVEARVFGKLCSVAKWDSVKHIEGAQDAASEAERLMSEGKTVVGVTEEGRLIGLIALSDTLKEGAAECVQELTGMGVGTVMLTGDNGAAASHMAAQLGVTEVSHSLLPAGKLDKIEALKAEGKRVCMVGDGVNDAPALAAADCSVAMGALGSDVAIETAEVALMGSDVRKLPALLRLGRRVLGTIKGNIILSMSINLVSVILSAFGILNPITGALVHNISSVLVVTNSALILARGKDKKGNKS